MAETADAALTFPGTTGTAKCIALHAAERPEAAALIVDGRAVSYAEFSRDIDKFATALRDLGLPQGAMAAVQCRSLYTHWRLLLAFEQLNVATASFDEREGAGAYADLLAGADLVLSDEGFGGVDAKRQFAITPAWVRDALAREPAEGAVKTQRSPDDIVRILRTSGTTGRAKRFAFTRRMHELRTLRYGERYRFTRGSRYLRTLPFSIGLPYGCATACLRAGGCVVDVTGEGMDVIPKYGITHLTLLPHQLKAFLEGLPLDFVKPANLTIFTSGSALPDQLAERALQSLATELFDNFGCNEVGSISFRRAPLRDGFAEISSGTEVEVVDESGRPLPSGVPGQLRVRSESMVTGYLDDPEATRRFFKDGWFYPSDIAVLDGRGRLRVIGRADEMLTTIGGKYAPSDLEAIVAARLGEGDVGVCRVADKDGIEIVYVAVAGARLGHEELLARVTEAFGPLIIGDFRVVAMKAIPRNAAGKIQRDQLKDTIARGVRSSV